MKHLALVSITLITTIAHLSASQKAETKPAWYHHIAQAINASSNGTNSTFGMLRLLNKSFQLGMPADEQVKLPIFVSIHGGPSHYATDTPLGWMLFKYDEFKLYKNLKQQLSDVATALTMLIQRGACPTAIVGGQKELDTYTRKHPELTALLTKQEQAAPYEAPVKDLYKEAVSIGIFGLYYFNTEDLVVTLQKAIDAQLPINEKFTILDRTCYFHTDTPLGFMVSNYTDYRGNPNYSPTAKNPEHLKDVTEAITLLMRHGAQPAFIEGGVQRLVKLHTEFPELQTLLIKPATPVTVTAQEKEIVALLKDAIREGDQYQLDFRDETEGMVERVQKALAAGASANTRYEVRFGGTIGYPAQDTPLGFLVHKIMLLKHIRGAAHQLPAELIGSVALLITHGASPAAITGGQKRIDEIITQSPELKQLLKLQPQITPAAETKEGEK